MLSILNIALLQLYTIKVTILNRSLPQCPCNTLLSVKIPTSSVLGPQSTSGDPEEAR